MSRHLPDGGLIRPPPGRGHHCCAPLPLHSHRWILVPSARPLWSTSMHLPSARTLPSEARVHIWAPVPLQSWIWIFVPSAVLLWLTSTHLARPVIVPVRAGDGPTSNDG